MPCTLEREDQWRRAGHLAIAGVDEAGRGPLAGPVVTAAVVLPADFEHTVLTDSKKLSPKVRERLYAEITQAEDIQWASDRAEPKEIDTINILAATHASMARALGKLPQPPDVVLVDGLPIPRFPYSHEGIVKGDSLSLSIAAASIIAKVERDRYMVAMAKQFPQYGFERHKGYPTKAHLEALREHGPSPIHRRSFRPVSQMDLDFSSPASS